jgi:hypothetical protein
MRSVPRLTKHLFPSNSASATFTTHKDFIAVERCPAVSDAVRETFDECRTTKRFYELVFVECERVPAKMFRASPWVPYDPTRNSSSSPPNPAASIPDEMDAPQISVLQPSPTNDDSPPPQPRPAKFRIKLLVNEPGRPSSSGSSAAIKVPTLGSHELDIEDEDEEDEEDQLIDDDDDDGRAPLALSRSVDTTPKRKAASPRKRARKGDKKVEDEKKIILPGTCPHPKRLDR